MEPIYLNETRYSYLVGAWRRPSTGDYQTETPETEFERKVQSLYLEGQTHLHREEFLLALDTFREMMALILHTANPKMPVDPNRFHGFAFPLNVELLDVLTAKSGAMLRATRVESLVLPATILSSQPILPSSVEEQLKPVLANGLQITSHHLAVEDTLTTAIAAAGREDWRGAADLYAQAFDQTPAEDQELRASILHDQAILAEKLGDREGAEQIGRKASGLFLETGRREAQVESLEALSGILRRAGKADEAGRLETQAGEIRKSVNLNDVLAVETPRRLSPNALLAKRFVPGRLELRNADLIRRSIGEGNDVGALQVASERTLGVIGTSSAPKLMATRFINLDRATKSLGILGEKTAASIVLDNNAGVNIKNFLSSISISDDVSLLWRGFFDPVQFVAYLPHMYFFAIPMAIGDCLAGLGNLQQAATQYASVLPYPFINLRYEAVKIWTRLAQTYLALGDEAYRRAREDAAGYAAARTFYERIVRLDRTLDGASPLYADAKFAGIRGRVTALLTAADPVGVAENPAISLVVLDALSRIGQIDQGLNFFGFDPNYVPPFSFEYLQNTARYFGQQSSQIEQRYIQFKSQAENETLKREQLDQQAEVARQTVVLEARGRAEAVAGVEMAAANVNYAEAQRGSAEQAQADFEARRWELLEYAELEAWAGAASVDEDDEVELTISGFSYYNASGRDRSDVVLDLAARRTRVSHDLEARKLQRAIDTANAYKQVAEAQRNQAQARVAVADQRIAIARLQQRQAEENRDFLDMREFGERLWYELAQQARRLKQRYLDMATEIAFLMERAYNAETERGLHLIRYDYSQPASNNLMGADLLLADIDYFTLDHVTTVKTKKVPVKQAISLADSYAVAFQQLKQVGRCTFATELADFDRKHPGLYLCKLRNVEIVFVGLGNALGIAGTLRNVGVSLFRLADGTTATRMYPADVMVLSQYEIRQDALAFRFNPNDLRLFENNGIETLWQLELPLDANDWDPAEILDVQLVLYYDGFFSPALETQIRGALPNNGTASRGFSLRMSFPDEMFYLRNKGEAQIAFDAGLFPRNQKNFRRDLITVMLRGDPGLVGSVTLRLASRAHGTEISLTTDAQGEINAATPGNPLSVLLGETILDEWTIRITAEDNPALSAGGILDLQGLADILVFMEYGFDYR